MEKNPILNIRETTLSHSNKTHHDACIHWSHLTDTPIRVFSISEVVSGVVLTLEGLTSPLRVVTLDNVLIYQTIEVICFPISFAR